MSTAVRFTEDGGLDVLNVVEVDRSVPAPRQVLVKVVAVGISPGEAMTRQGLVRDRFR